VEEMKTKRLHVTGDFPEFVVTNKSGTGYRVKLDPHGTGTCTCPEPDSRARSAMHVQGNSDDPFQGAIGK
jgi:hypothetical protein